MKAKLNADNEPILDAPEHEWNGLQIEPDMVGHDLEVDDFGKYTHLCRECGAICNCMEPEKSCQICYESHGHVASRGKDHFNGW